MKKENNYCPCRARVNFRNKIGDVVQCHCCSFLSCTDGSACVCAKVNHSVIFCNNFISMSLVTRVNAHLCEFYTKNAVPAKFNKIPQKVDSLCNKAKQNKNLA